MRPRTSRLSPRRNRAWRRSFREWFAAPGRRRPPEACPARDRHAARSLSWCRFQTGLQQIQLGKLPGGLEYLSKLANGFLQFGKAHRAGGGFQFHRDPRQTVEAEGRGGTLDRMRLPLDQRAFLDARGKLRHLARGILQECAQHLEYVGFADLGAERIKGGLVE